MEAGCVRPHPWRPWTALGPVARGALLALVLAPPLGAWAAPGAAPAGEGAATAADAEAAAARQGQATQAANADTPAGAEDDAEDFVAPPREDATPLLFWRLASLGVDEATVARVRERLLDEILTLGTYRLVEAKTEGDSELARCTAGVECVARIGRRSGASLALTGVLSALGDTRSLELRLVDTREGRLLRSVAQTWSGDENSLLAAIREATVRLLAPERFVGTLVLSVRDAQGKAAEGVKVYVDGDYIGRTPLEPLTLPPGRHTVRLRSPLHEDLERFVDIAFEDTARLTVTLQSTEQRAIAPAKPPRGPIGIGLSAGLHGNGGALLAPELQVSSDYAIALSGALYGGVEIAVGGARLTGQARLLPGRDSRFDLQLTVLALLVRLGYRFLPDRLSPYLVVSGGIASVLEETESSDFTPVGWAALRPAGRVAVGLDFELPFGELFLEGGGSYTGLPARGALRGPLVLGFLQLGARIRP